MMTAIREKKNFENPSTNMEVIALRPGHFLTTFVVKNGEDSLFLHAEKKSLRSLFPLMQYTFYKQTLGAIALSIRSILCQELYLCGLCVTAIK